jgi:DNA repair protein RAD57
MIDLHHVLPNFPTQSHTHLIPSLEKHLVTVTDLLTLDATDIARHAQLPVLDIRRLATQITLALQEQLGLNAEGKGNHSNPRKETKGVGKASLQRSGNDLKQLSTISTLDDKLDAALGGGIPAGYITEVTGERSAQMPSFSETC